MDSFWLWFYFLPSHENTIKTRTNKNKSTKQQSLQVRHFWKQLKLPTDLTPVSLSSARMFVSLKQVFDLHTFTHEFAFGPNPSCESAHNWRESVFWHTRLHKKAWKNQINQWLCGIILLLEGVKSGLAWLWLQLNCWLSKIVIETLANGQLGWFQPDQDGSGSLKITCYLIIDTTWRWKSWVSTQRWRRGKYSRLV